MFIVAVIAFFIVPFLLKEVLLSITVLDSEPLRKTLVDFLVNRPFQMPIYVATAWRKKIFDPDDPLWITQAVPVSHTPTALKAADEKGPWDPKTKSKWIPRYFGANHLKCEQVANLLLASAALPFGIVKPVQIGSTSYVDGGVVDNLPILPLLHLKLDEIVVLDLTPESEAKEKVDYHMRTALLARLIRLEKEPLPERAHGTHPGRDKLYPPNRYPVPNLTFPPALIFLRPRQKLGKIFDGTLNFSPDYATRVRTR